MLISPSDLSPAATRKDKGAAAGLGPGYSLHEFTRGPLRAKSHEVIHTDDSPRVPVPAQGTCRAQYLGHSDAPSVGDTLVSLLLVRAPPRLPGVQRTKAWLHVLAWAIIHRGQQAERPLYTGHLIKTCRQERHPHSLFGRLEGKEWCEKVSLATECQVSLGQVGQKELCPRSTSWQP